MAYIDENYSNEPVEHNEPFPVGRYHFTIKKAEVEATKLGDGEKIKLMVSIRDGKKTRIEFVNLNIVNKNPQAQEIARRQLTQLRMCANLGEGELRDTDQLVGVQGTASATIEESLSGELRNKLSNFKPLDKEFVEEMEEIAAPIKTKPPLKNKESVFDLDRPAKKEKAITKPKAEPVEEDDEDEFAWAR